MATDKLLLLFVILSLSAIAVVAVLGEVRRRRFQPEPTKDHIFRCARCGFVYTDDADVGRSRCSQCGTLNEAIQF